MDKPHSAFFISGGFPCLLTKLRLQSVPERAPEDAKAIFGDQTGKKSRMGETAVVVAM